MLISEGICCAAVAMNKGQDRTYLVIGMIALMFLLVVIVATFGYLGRGLGSQKISTEPPKYSLLLGPPEDSPEFNIAEIEWEDKECFLVSNHNNLRAQIMLVPSKIGPSLRVEIPEKVLDSLQTQHPFELQLKDRKGHSWRVKRFFIFENLIRLSWAQDKEAVLKDYGVLDE